MRQALLAGVLVLAPAFADPAPRDGGDGRPYFTIQVVDDETGRGVPLIELRTVNALRCWTDSNGVVAFREPGLMGTDVFFSVAGHGYEYPADGFGNRGARLHVAAGESATLKIHRNEHRPAPVPAHRRRNLRGQRPCRREGAAQGAGAGRPGFRFGQRAERGPPRQGLLVLGRHQPPLLPAGPVQRAGRRVRPAVEGRPRPGGRRRSRLLHGRQGAGEGDGPDARQGADVADRPRPADGRRRPGTAVRFLRQGRAAAEGVRPRLGRLRRRQGGVRGAIRLGHAGAGLPVGPRLPPHRERRRLDLFRQSLSADARSGVARPLPAGGGLRDVHLPEGRVASRRPGPGPRRQGPAPLRLAEERPCRRPGGAGQAHRRRQDEAGGGAACGCATATRTSRSSPTRDRSTGTTTGGAG